MFLNYFAWMMKICLCLLILNGCSTTKPTMKDSLSAAVTATDDEFQLNLNKILSRSVIADFTQLRLNFTDTSHYNPYLEGSTNEIWEAVNTKDYALCIQLATERLHSNYISLDAHYASMICNFEIGEKEKGSYHRYVFEGLVDSIRQSGDGLTAKTAYLITSANELYSFLAISGLEVKGQSLVNENGGAFDLMQVYDPRTEQEFSLYFDISLQISKGMKFLD